MKWLKEYIDNLKYGFFIPGRDPVTERIISSRARAYTIYAVLIVVVIGVARNFQPIQGVNLPVRVSGNSEVFNDTLNLSVYPPTLVRQVESLDWEGQYRETFITTKGIVYRWKDGPKVITQVLLKPNVCTQIKGLKVLLTITTDQYITSTCPQ